MEEKKVLGRIWIDIDNKNFLGKGKVELLKKIDEYGSISKAAKDMKMSYKAAWDIVKEINTLAKSPILETKIGGEGGGGSVLTQKGKQLIAAFETIERDLNKFLKNAQNKINKLLQD
ncbi:winged helix-turn-helix domain-containing protein [Desulfurella sp.]|uniref:winged helix-turn-helix domain-containing protein n=3 Tax=Desulfurella sp. TaxID=1962857 RepID=UPI0025BA8E52|nr:LysR family transcriptional regulator [Desulfurella sp.]